ncbi:unnamed protein product [Trichobilharzia szidati]|nr:unnamed protein product [Trichobilharzia szidati]
MPRCCSIFSSKNGFLMILATLLIPLYISLELCFFISDQYVFYRCTVDEGLLYEYKDGKFALNEVNKTDETLLKQGQRRAAWIGACNHSVRLMLGLLTTMVMGYISDRFGRRIALGTMIVGEALQIIALSIVVSLQASAWFTIIPGLFDGVIGGGLLSIQAQVSASLVDVVNREKQIIGERKESVNNKDKHEKELWGLFTWFDGISLISLSLSNPIGGALLYRDGFRSPIIVCNCLVSISLILIFFLPESNIRISQKRSSQSMMTSDINCKSNCEHVEVILPNSKKMVYWKMKYASIRANFKASYSNYFN